MIKTTFTVDVSIPRFIYNFSFFSTGSKFHDAIYGILDGCIHKNKIETDKLITFSATYDELEDAALVEHDLTEFFKTTCEEYRHFDSDSKCQVFKLLSSSGFQKLSSV